MKKPMTEIEALDYIIENHYRKVLDDEAIDVLIHLHDRLLRQQKRKEKTQQKDKN